MSTSFHFLPDSFVNELFFVYCIHFQFCQYQRKNQEMGIIKQFTSQIQQQQMDLFEFPDGYVPQKYLTSEEMQDIEDYLKNHPLFLKKLPEDLESNQHLQALMQLKEDEDPTQAAENLNKQANKKLNENPNRVYNMKQAYEKYTQAINIKCPSPAINAKLHANRAQLNLKLKNYGKVVQDCKKCLEYDPDYVKGYFRYAKALIALQKYQDCIKLLEPRPEGELKQLLTEAKNKNKQKQLQEQKKKGKKQQAENEIKKLCESKGWKYLKRDQPLPQGAKAQIIDNKLSIPLMIVYPEFGQFDLVASSFEEHKIKDHLKQMLEAGLPWDSKHEYSLDNIQIYCQISEAVLMKIPKQAKISDILSRVPFRQALQLQVVRKDNTFYNSYLPQHKII